MRIAIGLLLLAGCERSTPTTAPERAKLPAVHSGVAAVEPSAAPAPPTPTPAATPTPQSTPPALVGRLVEIQAGKEPVVVIETEGERVSIRGVDAKGLSFKPDDQLSVVGPARQDGVVDCTEPHHCSVGLARGGNVVLRDANAFAVMHMLSKLRANVFLVGPSRRASLELRADTPEALVRGLASAFGLSTRRRGKVTLMAPQATLTSLEVAPLGLPNTPVDLHLVGARLDNVSRLLTDVTKSNLSGDLRGEISVVARELGASEALSTSLSLCGVKHRQQGKKIAVHEQSDVCASDPLPAPRCPPTGEPRQQVVESGLSCVDPAKLRVLATARLPRSPAVALLGSGEPHGDEVAVREGDFLAQSEVVRTSTHELQLNWKVAAITGEHVELQLAHPEQPEVKEKRLRIPVR